MEKRVGVIWVGRAFVTVSFVVSVVAIATILSGCSAKNSVSPSSERQIFPQQPGPMPVPSSAPTPSPSPSFTPTPSPTAVPSPVPIACDGSTLAPWNHWSVFAGMSATIRGMDIAEGLAARVLAIDGLDLGYGLSRDVSRFDLVADTLDFGWTTVNAGSAACGSKVKFRQGVDVFGGTQKAAPLDFDTEYDRLVDLQFRILDLKLNGETKTVCETPGKNCELILTGSDAHVNRFHVAAGDLVGIRKITVNVPRRATAVVLIQAKDVTWKDVDVSGPAETIWTLGEPHGKFRIDFMTLPGTVVLASSIFEIDQALVMGRVLTKDFVSAACNDERACATVDSQDLPDKICL